MHHAVKAKKYRPQCVTQKEAKKIAFMVKEGNMAAAINHLKSIDPQSANIRIQKGKDMK